MSSGPKRLAGKFHLFSANTSLWQALTQIIWFLSGIQHTTSALVRHLIWILRHDSINANQADWKGRGLRFLCVDVTIWLFVRFTLALRVLLVYPQTKIYFGKWDDLSFSSSQVKNHGKTVMGGVATAVANIDDLTNGLKNLSKFHANDLKVDPTNFKVNYWFQSYRNTIRRKTKPAFHSSCVIAFSWSSPWCSPKTSPRRSTSHLINSWPLWHWLSLSSTAKLPDGICCHVTVLQNNKTCINKFLVAQTWQCDFYVSPK